MKAFFLTILLVLFHFTIPFNLDFEYTVVKAGPKNSLFGFSVAEHVSGANKLLLVGAPRANNSHSNLVNVHNPGTVFKCDSTQPQIECTDELEIGNEKSATESKANQWLGVSLESGGSENFVVTCAHRHEYYGKLKNYRLLTGKCYILDEDLDIHDYYYPCQGLVDSESAGTPSHANYGQCETGVGLDISGSASYGFNVGSVGASWYSGRLFSFDDENNVKAKLHNTQPEPEETRDSYFGYSISHGKFTSNKKEIAVGGPRYRSHGQVIIYKTPLTGADLPTYLVPNDRLNDFDNFKNKNIQIASGFGIALCAVDFDNDGFDELVVSAPFYTSDRKTPDIGRIYIYKKDPSAAKLMQGMIVDGTKVMGNFGYSVINAGDLNLDGYPDLIVGAPHENNYQGAVYVFRGSADGMVEKPSQVIRAENVQSGLNTNSLPLEGFGRSLAGGVDMDANGYKDVFVGSYLSSHAVLLRARPIVIPKSSMKFIPETITVTKSATFDLKFCHNITEPNDKQTTKLIEIEYTLIADAEFSGSSRIKFSDGKDKIMVKVTSSSQTKCEEIKGLYLRDENVAEFPDVSFITTGKSVVEKPAKSLANVVSLDDYPVLGSKLMDGQVGQTAISKLKFKRECGESCIPDLKVYSEAANYTLRIGSKNFTLDIVVENNGPNPAYAVNLRVRVPKALSVDKVQQKSTSGVQKSYNCRAGVCEDIFQKLGKGKKKMLSITLNTKKFRPESENNITIEVSSANPDKPENLGDNEYKIQFEFKVVADLDMLAALSTQNINYKGQIKGQSAMENLDAVGQIVDHKFAVRNNGPDLLPSANLTIFWPDETLSGKHLLYLVTVDISSPKHVKCHAPRLNVADLKGLTQRQKDANAILLKGSGTVESSSNDDTTSSSERVRREITDVDDGNANKTAITIIEKPKDEKPPAKEDNRRKDGRVLDCRENTVKCVQITCQISNLPSGEAESVTVRSRLWEPSLLIDYYGEVLTIVSHASVELGTNVTYISDPNLENNANELYTVINPVKVKGKDDIAVWIIALAVVAGVILLMLLIFGLFKLGFFKRNRASQYSAKHKEQEKALVSK